MKVRVFLCLKCISTDGAYAQLNEPLLTTKHDYVELSRFSLLKLIITKYICIIFVTRGQCLLI